MQRTRIRRENSAVAVTATNKKETVESERQRIVQYSTVVCYLAQLKPKGRLNMLHKRKVQQLYTDFYCALIQYQD